MGGLLGVGTANATVSSFADGEIKIQLLDSVRGKVSLLTHLAGRLPALRLVTLRGSSS